MSRELGHISLNFYKGYIMPRRGSIWNKTNAKKISKLSGKKKIGLGIFLALGVSIPLIILGLKLNLLWFCLLLGIPDIIFGIALIFVGIIQSQEEKTELLQNIRRRQIYEEKLLKSNITSIDLMSGHQFEEYLSILFSKLGYNTQRTKLSGDYGADLILKKNEKTTVVQAKCYSQKVSLKAVQEIVSAISFYQADDGWVVTNNYFTQSAINLAQYNNIQLVDRNKLIDLIIKSNELCTNDEDGMKESKSDK